MFRGVAAIPEEKECTVGGNQDFLLRKGANVKENEKRSPRRELLKTRGGSRGKMSLHGQNIGGKNVSVGRNSCQVVGRGKRG